MLALLGNTEYPFVVIAPTSTLAQSSRPDRVLSMRKIELNSVFMQN